jgi:hypothetical protein
LTHFLNDKLNLEKEQVYKPIIETRERRRKKKMYAEITGGFERSKRVLEPYQCFIMIYGTVWSPAGVH